MKPKFDFRRHVRQGSGSTVGRVNGRREEAGILLVRRRKFSTTFLNVSRPFQDQRSHGCSALEADRGVREGERDRGMEQIRTE